MKYVQNPTEEAQKLRGLLFVNFIGGLVASDHEHDPAADHDATVARRSSTAYEWRAPARRWGGLKQALGVVA